MKHRGEVEFDFRATLHTSLLDVAKNDGDEVWRLLKVLLTRSDTHTAAVVAGWDRPISIETLLLASLYTAWVGQRHPLIPEAPEQDLSDAESRLADMALESMNRR